VRKFDHLKRKKGGHGGPTGVIDRGSPRRKKIRGSVSARTVEEREKENSDGGVSYRRRVGRSNYLTRLKGRRIGGSKTGLVETIATEKCVFSLLHPVKHLRRPENSGIREKQEHTREGTFSIRGTYCLHSGGGGGETNPKKASQKGESVSRGRSADTESLPGREPRGYEVETGPSRSAKWLREGGDTLHIHAAISLKGKGTGGKGGEVTLKRFRRTARSGGGENDLVGGRPRAEGGSHLKGAGSKQRSVQMYRRGAFRHLPATARGPVVLGHCIEKKERGPKEETIVCEKGTEASTENACCQEKHSGSPEACLKFVGGEGRGDTPSPTKKKGCIVAGGKDPAGKSQGGHLVPAFRKKKASRTLEISVGSIEIGWQQIAERTTQPSETGEIIDSI